MSQTHAPNSYAEYVRRPETQLIDSVTHGFHEPVHQGRQEQNMNEVKTPDSDDRADRDPITKAPGAHPVGVGIGAAIGGAAAGVATAAATGAAAGTVAGPVGTVVGAAVGAVLGGLAGKAVAERYDPTVEDGYWLDHHANEPYYNADRTYDDYSPAYRAAGEAHSSNADRHYGDVEVELERGWDASKGTSRLSWEEARPAARAGWDRLARRPNEER